MRPATQQPHRAVLHDDCCPHSQQASPARLVSLSGAGVLTAGAVSPFFPRPAPLGLHRNGRRLVFAISVCVSPYL